MALLVRCTEMCETSKELIPRSRELQVVQTED